MWARLYAYIQNSGCIRTPSSNNMTAPVVLCTFRHYFHSPMLITTRRSQSVFSRPDSKSLKQPEATCGEEYVKAVFNSCSPTEVGLDCTLQVPMEQMESEGVSGLQHSLPHPQRSLEREWCEFDWLSLGRKLHAQHGSSTLNERPSTVQLFTNKTFLFASPILVKLCICTFYN